jgi:DNA-binding transcriptional LysR family regulator
MNETNFDWDDLRLFLAVARKGGLAAAAQTTGKSAPTLGRRMLMLERRLGQELFVRLPRGYELTDYGQALLDKSAALEREIGPLVENTEGGSVRRVKISAGTWVTHLLSKHISRLITDESIVLQFITADHVLDIAHREAVIGVRNHRPTQSTLAGRRTSEIQFAAFAVNEKVEQWVQVSGDTPSAQWVHRNHASSCAIEVSNPRVALDMAISGAVRALLPTFIGKATKELIQVSDEVEELHHTQWLVTHHEDRHLPEVRCVIDRIYDILTTDFVDTTP